MIDRLLDASVRFRWAVLALTALVALYGAFQLIARMRAAGETGSVVTLICDSGIRYTGTYYSDEWVAAQGWDLAPHRARMERFLETGDWVE